MEKIDLKKDLKLLYQPSAKEVVEVEVPTMNFLMVDGMGDPNTSKAYQEAIEVLYQLSYTLKFMMKKGPSAIDYGVMPLESLWWADDMKAFVFGNKDQWKWTAMIMQPGIITRQLVDAAIAEVKKKKNPAALPLVRFESLSEGRAAQIMYTGPFSEEGPTIEKIHKFIESRGLKPVGKHHEIYLSDMRRVEPAKWKTVIRQPMG
ncbi:MAG: GyrI-like domain-containing protein [Dehalococcoidia bacterium]|nr:GyrI-like domain-containing protein [Dehalococcoidia bacterium]